MIPSFKGWKSYNVAEHGLHTKCFKILGIIENTYHEIKDWNLFVFQAISITDYDYGVRLQIKIGGNKEWEENKKRREKV